MSINPRVLFDRPLAVRPRVSLILLDWSCRESFHIFEYLAKQEAPRDWFEVVWIEYYDRVAPEIEQRLGDSARRGDTPPLDRWIVMNMPRTAYYHKHLMYNVGVMASRGELVMIGDSDAIVTPRFVQALCEPFDADPDIVLHLDEVRSRSRQFYPFNYPSVEEVLGEGCVNWNDGTTTGLRETADPIHTLNYGACFCARRADIVSIGGADEHIDYLGHICGPYDLTWRLVNSGRREQWHPREFLYHVWHPGSDGDDNYLGPHDGRNVSSVALDARRARRVMPLTENPVIRRMRETGAEPDGDLESAVRLAIGDRPLGEWAIDDVKRTVSAGRAALSQHRYADALAAWEPLLPRMQRDARFLSDVGWAYYFRGRYTSAAEAFTRSLALAPDNPDALRGLGWTEMQQGASAEAVQTLTRAIDLLDPLERASLLEAYRGRGWAHFHQLQLEPAADDFHVALERTGPEDVGSLQDLHRALGWVSLKRMQFDRAAEHFSAALAALGDRRGPEYEDAQAGLKQSRKQAELAPRSARGASLEELRAELASRLRADLGWTFVERGEYRRAKDVFREAAKLDASNPQALCGLAWSVLETGDVVRSLKLFNRVVGGCADASCRQQALFGRGCAYYRRGEGRKAAKDFTEAIRLADERGDARAARQIRLARSRAYFLAGDKERARKDLARTKHPHPWQVMLAMRAVQLRHHLARVIVRGPR